MIENRVLRRWALDAAIDGGLIEWKDGHLAWAEGSESQEITMRAWRTKEGLFTVFEVVELPKGTIRTHREMTLAVGNQTKGEENEK